MDQEVVRRMDGERKLTGILQSSQCVFIRTFRSKVLAFAQPADDFARSLFRWLLCLFLRGCIYLASLDGIYLQCLK